MKSPFTFRAVCLALALLGGVAGAQTPAPSSLPNPAALLERYTQHRSSAPALAQGGQTWTVLVYLHADHNLWTNALFDLLEMQQVGSTNGVRFVVQIDAPAPGSDDTNGFESFNGGLRALVTRSPTNAQSRATANGAVPALQVLERLPEQNSDDPRVLAEFINWGMRRFPADRYGVVLWDHGGQWDGGFGGDESSGGNGMATWQVREGLEAGMAQARVGRLDFLGLDTCLMGGAEMLYEYGDLANVYIASPEIDYGDGWDYTAVFGLLRNNPGVSSREFGRAEVGFFDAHHQGSRPDLDYRAHAAYDTALMPELRGAINAFVASALQSTDRNALLQARSRVTEYRFNPSRPNAPRPYVDIGQYGALVAQLSSDAGLARAGQNLAAAVNRIVIDKSLGNKVKSALGLAVWLPNDPSRPNPRELAAYTGALKMAKSVNWNAFIDLWYGRVTQGAQPVDVRITRVVNLLEPTDREPAAVSFDVLGNANLIYGELGEVGERNNFKSYGHLYLQPGGSGQYTYEWDGRWFEVTGASGSSDFYTGFYQRSGDSAFFASALYTPPRSTQTSPVIVVADVSTGRLVSALDDSSIAPRDIELAAGGRLAFQFVQRDQLTEESTLQPTGRSVTIPPGGLSAMRLERKRMPLGEYALIFGARDAAGNIRTGYAPVQIR
jgi:hypothetical protein